MWQSRQRGPCLQGGEHDDPLEAHHDDQALPSTPRRRVVSDLGPTILVVGGIVEDSDHWRAIISNMGDTAASDSGGDVVFSGAFWSSILEAGYALAGAVPKAAEAGVVPVGHPASFRMELFF